MLNETEGKEIVMWHVSKAIRHWLGFPSSPCKSEVQAFFAASVQQVWGWNAFLLDEIWDAHQNVY
jgi:hypothetical protein